MKVGRGGPGPVSSDIDSLSLYSTTSNHDDVWWWERLGRKLWSRTWSQLNTGNLNGIQTMQVNNLKGCSLFRWRFTCWCSIELWLVHLKWYSMSKFLRDACTHLSRPSPPSPQKKLNFSATKIYTSRINHCHLRIRLQNSESTITNVISSWKY